MCFRDHTLNCQGVRQEEGTCKERGRRVRGDVVVLSSWPNDVVAWHRLQDGTKACFVSTFLSEDQAPM